MRHLGEVTFPDTKHDRENDSRAHACDHNGNGVLLGRYDHLAEKKNPDGKQNGDTDAGDDTNLLLNHKILILISL